MCQFLKRAHCIENRNEISFNRWLSCWENMLKFILLPLVVLTACSDGNRNANANPPMAQSDIAGNGAAANAREAKAAYEAALPVLGDMTIFAVGRGEDTLSARPIAEDAIVALEQARNLLLSGKATATPLSSGDPFALFRDAPKDQIKSAKQLWAVSRTTSCASVVISNCEQRYDGLLFILADSAGLEGDEQADDSGDSKKMTSKYHFPTCASLRASGHIAAAHLADFEKTFPAEIVAEESVNKLDLSAEDLRSIGSYASCVTGLTPNMPPEIADAALSLYASNKHGRAAFAALDSLARSGGKDANFAREFAVQMRDYVKEPSE
jgi:hypothetical protein